MVRSRWVSRAEALKLRTDLTRDRLLAALQAGLIEARNRITHFPIPPSYWLPHTFRNRIIPEDHAAGRRAITQFGEFLFDPNIDTTCDYPDGIADIPPGAAELLRSDIEALDDPPSDDDDSKEAREARAKAWAKALTFNETRSKGQLCDYAVNTFSVTQTAFYQRVWPHAPGDLKKPGRRKQK